MLGAGEHTVSASSSTLTNWATRAVARDGWPQILGRVPSAGNKVIPVCHGLVCPSENVLAPNRTLCPCDQKVWGEARLVQGGAAAAECEARRFALYSEAAMRVLQS